MASAVVVRLAEAVLPAMVEKILLVIIVLIAVLVLIRLLWPALSTYNWWGPPRP